MSENNFPKFQYSLFLKGNRSEQVVIRSNDWEEFKELKEKVDLIVEKVETRTEQNGESQEPKQNGGDKSKPCLTCGADAVKRSGEKNGKKWAGWFCQENEHVEWENLK